MKYQKYNDYELLYLVAWHSDEALNILIKKYEVMIRVKLRKFNILEYHYADYFQELQMSLYKAIKTYNEAYGKTLCRFIELVLERRLIRLLENEKRNISTINFFEEELTSKKEDILETMIYEQRILDIQKLKLDNLKKDILNDVLLGDVSVKEFAENNNITAKDVYNHVYLLRSKLKDKY